MITNLYYKSKKSASWQPTDIAGCQLWLKADAGITKDGSDYVSAWADQSGNGNDAVQATGGAQPLWVDAQLGGNAVVDFNGISNFLDFPHGMFYNLANISFFIVIKPYNITSNKGYFAPSLYYNQGISIYSYPDWTLNVNGTKIFGSAPNAIITESTWTLSSFIYSTDGNTGYINGNTVIPIYIYHVGNLSLNGVYALGRYAGSVGNYYGKMIVAEVIAYDSALTDTDRQLVETYLNTKYALW